VPAQQQKQQLPDFVALKERFDMMGNGPRADLRRIKSVEAVADLPAYYRWLQGTPDSLNLRRVAFFMPYVGHRLRAAPLGRQLALSQHRVSEMRLFQILRSEAPRDLEHLRRLAQQIKPHLDWAEFGKTLFYWREHSKRRILQDYFTPKKEDNEKSGGEHHER
jgi:CRISPR system Cascade subunit CasB